MKFINIETAKSFDDVIQENEYLNKAASSVLYIVPTNRSVFALRKQVIQNPALNPASFPHIFTLDGLAKALFKKLKKFTLVSDAGGLAILRRIVKSSESHYFGNYRGEMPHGTLRQLRSLFIAMKRNGVDPDELLAAPVEESSKAKYLDFCDLYKNYCGEFADSSLYEMADIYTELLKTDDAILQREVLSLFGSVKYIKVVWFTGFSYSEAGFIFRLAGFSRALAVIDFDASMNSELFAAAVQTASILESVGFLPFEVNPAYLNKKRIHLQKHLFNPFPPENKLQAQFIELPHCASRADEAEKIAEHICFLIKQKGVRPEQIAVGFKLINEYSVNIRKVFSDYGIPFDLTDRFSLSDNIIAGKVFALLKLQESNFYYQDLEAVYGYFQGGLLKGSVSFMIEYAKRNRILTDSQKWLASLDEQIDKAVTGSNYRDENKINKMRILKQDIEILVKMLNCFRQKLTPVEFKNGILNLLNEAGYPGLLFSATEEQMMLNTQAYKQFLTVLNELTIIEQTEAEAKAGKLSSEYIAQLRTALYEARYNYPKGYFNGVLITTYEELRGQQFDYVFFAGMYEGNFPAKYARDIIAVEKNTSAEKRYLSEQRYLFYQLLAHFNGTLFFSYPTKEESTEFSESHFLYHLRRVCVIREAEEINTIYSLRKKKIEEGKALRGKSVEARESKLAESIAIDRNRLSNKSVFNGYLETGREEVAEVMKKVSAKTFSYSSLNVLVQCPFRFFLEEVLKLRSEELPDDELKAKETGTIIHRILKRFIGELIREGKSISGLVTEKGREERLFTIAEEELKNELKDLPPLSQFELEKITGIDGNKSESLLKQFIENEKTLETEVQRTPKFLEHGFGGDGQTPVRIGGFSVRGQIDRVDIYTKDGEEYLAIVDYKTGMAPELRPGEMKEKKLLQLPMYAMAFLATNELLEEKLKIGKLYYDIIKFSKDSGYRELGNKKIDDWLEKFKAVYPDFVNSTDEQPEVFLEMTEHILQVLYAELIEGSFHLVEKLSPKSAECTYCGFYTICRKQEQFET